MLSRITILRILAGISTGFCGMAAAQNNLLQNGNFERAVDPANWPMPTFWTEVYAYSSIRPSVSSTAYFGRQCLRIDDDNPSGGEGVISDKIAVLPGVIYTVEGWIRQYESTADGDLYIKYYNASDIEIGSIAASTSTVGWWAYVSQSLRAPKDTSYAKVICVSTVASTGKMLFDGVAFYRAATQSLVDNPDFSLDNGVGTPINWTRVGTSGTVSVLYNRLRLEDTSTTNSVRLDTTDIPVWPGVDYTASASAYVASGSAGAAMIYLKFYNDQGAEVSSAAKSLSTQSTWTELSIVAKAPATAATARLLAYSNSVGTGVFYFDNFNLTPSYLQRYVAPTAQGTGNGDSPANAAKFNDYYSSNFWSRLATDLQTSSVKVTFLNGDYAINTPADVLYIRNHDVVGGLGHFSSHLLLEGQSVYGARFVRTDNNTAFVSYMVEVAGTMNMTMRNLHWQDLQTSPDFWRGYYALAIFPRGTEPDEPCTYPTDGIVLEGLSFVHLPYHTRGALGPYGTCVTNITVRNCEFVRVGEDIGAHILYNIFAGDVAFRDNYCEDCSGAYVRFRGQSENCVVDSNIFVSTGSWTNSNMHFIEVAVFNSTDPGVEWFGSGYSFTNNEFQIWTPTPNLWGWYGRAISIHHCGYDPFDGSVTRQHLLTSPEGYTLLNGTTYQKKDLIENHYFLDFDDTASIEISGNTRIGYHEYDLELETVAAGGCGAPPQGGEGAYNISDVDGD